MDEQEPQLGQRLVAFLRDHGEVVGGLRLAGSAVEDVEPDPARRVDLTGVMLAKHCPNLAVLRLHHGRVDGSVFEHPSLTTLELSRSMCTGPRHVDLDTGSRLTTIVLDSCAVDTGSLRVGPGSPLRRLRIELTSYLYAFAFRAGPDDHHRTFARLGDDPLLPRRFVFDNCRQLRSIEFDVEAGRWELVLRGALPLLAEVRQEVRPYAGFTFTVQNATPEDEARYRTLISEGSSQF
jgi:hypothetical protein